MFKNPITLWLKRTISNKYLEISNKQNNLKIGRMSVIHNCIFSRYNVIGDYVSLFNVKMNDLSYVGSRTIIKNTEIGKFCSIAPGSTIGLGKHPASKFVSTHPAFFSPLCQSQISFVIDSYFIESERIKIGNDVWIGANVTIIDGIEIADGVIVAAGSIVTKDIPPYAIVGGNPAKIIRYRFEAEEIEYLIKFQWWNKNLEWLQKNHKLFLDIKSLLESKFMNEKGMK